VEEAGESFWKNNFFMTPRITSNHMPPPQGRKEPAKLPGAYSANHPPESVSLMAYGER
jgi:hypothetical protein